MSLIEKAVERLAGLQPNIAEKRDSAVGVPGLPMSDTEHAHQTTRGLATTERTGATEQARSRYVELDLDRLATSGFLTPKAPSSLIAEEFRVIKRPLIGNMKSPSAPIPNANLIMVTSSLPEEGKSFTAVNLAISLAMELDRTVLLIDADVARPSLPGVLGVGAEKGLLDILQDRKLPLSDVLLRTNIEKLTFLMAGTQTQQATELLASEAMERLLDEMSRRYPDRIIVFDSPPLLVTTEARALATRMGQIVFVVRAEETPEAAVKEALATIESCPVKLMVLNQARNVENVAYGYDYGYGY